MYERHARRLRRAAGPAATYSVGSYRMEAGGPELRRDDVIVEVDRNPTEPVVWPPVVVLSDPLPIRGTRARLYITRERPGLEPVPYDRAVQELERRGVAARLDRQRFIRDDAVRRALLSLFDLSVPKSAGR